MKIGRLKAIPEAGFDLTPMIDVVLLLIIFFVLSAQFAQAIRKPLSLPSERGEAPGELLPTTLILDVDERGDMWTGGTRLDLEGLRATMRSQVKLTGGADRVDVIVRAARDARSEHVNKVARVLTELNVRSWKLATAGGAP